MNDPKKTPVVLSTHQFFERFPDEASARSFIEQLREDGKPTCPRCKSQECGVWKPREGHYQCKGCRKIYSAKCGTVFERSKIP